MTLPIVHGPQLRSSPPRNGERRQPVTWSYGCRLNADMATKVDNLARENGVKVADIIRTALHVFLGGEPIPSNDPGRTFKLTEQTPPNTHTGPPTPTQHDRYRGNGKSDFSRSMAVNRSNQDRKSSGNSGERLMDKTPVR